MSGWDRFLEWEKKTAERFDRKKSKTGSNYNLHHSIMEATADEIGELFMEPVVEVDKAWHVLRTDGSGNGSLRAPDEGAIGVVITDSAGNEVGKISEWIGPSTNTLAEYWALIEGLRLAKTLEIKRLDIQIDSDLLVRQLHGQARVRKPYLLPFKRRVVALLSELGRENYKLTWVSRSNNSVADALATKALRQHADQARASRPLLARLKMESSGDVSRAVGSVVFGCTSHG